MHSHGVLRGLPEVPHEEPHEVPHEVPHGVTYGVPDGIPAGVLSVPTGSWWMLLGFDHHDMNHGLIRGLLEQKKQWASLMDGGGVILHCLKQLKIAPTGVVELCCSSFVELRILLQKLEEGLQH